MDQMLWYWNALYLSNCIYLTVLNTTTDILQILYSPLNAVTTNKGPERSCALFMPRSHTATATSHLGKVTQSQPARGEWSSLATFPRLLAARFSAAPNRPWSSVSFSSHRQFLSLSPGKSSSLHLSPSLRLPLCSHQVYFVLTSSLSKHDGENHQFS